MARARCATVCDRSQHPPPPPLSPSDLNLFFFVFIVSSSFETRALHLFRQSSEFCNAHFFAQDRGRFRGSSSALSLSFFSFLRSFLLSLSDEHARLPAPLNAVNITSVPKNISAFNRRAENVQELKMHGIMQRCRALARVFLPASRSGQRESIFNTYEFARG